MRKSLFSRPSTFSSGLVLLSLTVLLGFRPKANLPADISGSFEESYNQYSYTCEYPLHFVVCNNGASSYSFLIVSFFGNGPSANMVQVTGVNGGSDVRIRNNNDVRITLGAGECATISLNALHGKWENFISASFNGEYSGEGVNVVFDNIATASCP